MRALRTPIQRVRTRTRMCEVENDRHVHSRARPFAALSRGPPFKTARAMDRRISALFCSRHTRERFRHSVRYRRNATGLIDLSALEC